MAGSSGTYSVTGVRADGSRHLLSLKLSLDDAIYLKRLFLEAGIFKAVFIHPDEPARSTEEIIRNLRRISLSAAHGARLAGGAAPAPPPCEPESRSSTVSRTTARGA